MNQTLAPFDYICRADKSGGGVSMFVRDCYTSTHVANFSVCHPYYEINVVKI